ncbi:MAG: NosD domain-containing protein [Thermogemmata sp.]|nr:NosD domain-containing protein [Thermogemmata sp.]
MGLLFDCLGEALITHKLQGGAGDPSANSFVEAVADTALRNYSQRRDLTQIITELEDLARWSFKEAVQKAVALVQNVTGSLTAAQDSTLVATAQSDWAADNWSELAWHLACVPQMVRQVLPLVEESFAVIPPSMLVQSTGKDWAWLVPPRPPRYRPGQALPGNPRWMLRQLLKISSDDEIWLVRHQQTRSQLGVVRFCLGTAGQELMQQAERVGQLLHLDRHPNVVPLLDAHLQGVTPWLLFEYVSGTFATWLRTLKERPAEQRLTKVMAALQQLAEALAFMHGQHPPLVHQHLQPSNILWDPVTQQLRLTDYGLGVIAARRIEQAEQQGRLSALQRLLVRQRGAYTPLYARSHRSRNGPPDPRDDVYAWGIVAYQTLIAKWDTTPGPAALRILRSSQAPEPLLHLILDCLADEEQFQPRDGREILQRWPRQDQTDPQTVRRDDIRDDPAVGNPILASAESLQLLTATSEPTHRLTPADNLADMIEALPAGSVIELVSGNYRLAQPLRINKSLSIRGAGRDSCIIICSAEGAVLEYLGPGRLILEGITVRHSSSTWAHGAVIHSGQVVIRSCRFTGAVWDQANRWGGIGLWLTGTATGLVSECECLGNGLHGLAVSGQAQCELLANRCEHNKGGIAFIDAATGIAQQNVCFSNEVGLWVASHSRPELIANRCQHNKSGIVYLGYASGAARQNVCSDNQAGIWVTGHCRPELIANRCEKNAICGLGYTDAAVGLARDNYCGNNRQYGIVVCGKACPELVTNRCDHNKYGILFMEAAAGVARDNICCNNDKHGMIVRDQARPELVANRCERNTQSGIVISDFAAGISRENICSHNGYHGIIVQGKARPKLLGNRCSGNVQSGILYTELAGGSARQNVCHGNAAGIVVQGQARPKLVANQCEHDAQGGMVFSDQASGTVRENVCSHNIAGIIVRKQARPDLIANRCEYNKHMGIGYSEQAAGMARQNVCSNNGEYGILIYNTAEPELAANCCQNNNQGDVHIRATK